MICDKCVFAATLPLHFALLRLKSISHSLFRMSSIEFKAAKSAVTGYLTKKSFMFSKSILHNFRVYKIKVAQRTQWFYGHHGGL